MSRVLIIGAGGFLGQNLARFFSERHEIVLTFHQTPVPAALSRGEAAIRLSVCDDDAVRQTIASVSPDVVINAAGNKDVRYCETHPDEARRINALGASNVARACRAAGARLVHISTDLVFEGSQGGYAETDVPRPVLTYGATKLEGERLVLAELPDAIVCRSGGIYGAGSPNLRWLSDELKAHRIVDCFTDVYNTPTYAWNLAEMIEWIVDRNLSGVFHTVGPQRVNRFEWFSMFAEECALDTSLLRPVEAGDRREALLLRPDASLSSEATRRTVRVPFDSVAQGFRRLKASGDA